MNILYISAEFNNKNGANKSASDVLYSFLMNGFEVMVVTYSSKVSLNKDLFQEGLMNKVKWIQVKRLLIFDRKSSLQRSAKFLLRKMLNVFYKKIEDINAKPDIIVVNSIGADDLFKKVEDMYSCPKVNIFRGSPESFGIDGAAYSVEYVSKRLSKYDFLVFVSDIVRNKWFKYNNLQDIPNLYLPNCCEEEVVDQIREKSKKEVRMGLYKDAGMNKFILVYVASVQYRKGHDLLLNHIEELFSAIKNLEIYFVGKTSGSYAKRMIDGFGNSSNGRRIHFVGEKNNALEYIYGADGLVFPSRAEALPRVILEAMALGTSIVSSDVDGVPELIQDGYNGLLFPTDQTDLMVRHLKSLKEPELRCKLEARSRKRYIEVFSRAQHITNYKRLIQAVSERHLIKSV